MKAHAKIVLITLILAVPAFALGHVIWPPTPEVMPTAGQLPWLMVISAIEALTFGFGVAYLATVWPMIKALSPAEKKKTIPPYLAIGWLLINWWPHDNIHIHNGMNVDGLIHIDYFFHLTLIIAAIIVARWLVSVLAEKKAAVMLKI